MVGWTMGISMTSQTPIATSIVLRAPNNDLIDNITDDYLVGQEMQEMQEIGFLAYALTQFDAVTLTPGYKLLRRELVKLPFRAARFVRERRGPTPWTLPDINSFICSQVQAWRAPFLAAHEIDWRRGKLCMARRQQVGGTINLTCKGLHKSMRQRLSPIKSCTLTRARRQLLTR